MERNELQAMREVIDEVGRRLLRDGNFLAGWGDEIDEFNRRYNDGSMSDHEAKLRARFLFDAWEQFEAMKERERDEKSEAALR